MISLALYELLSSLCPTKKRKVYVVRVGVVLLDLLLYSVDVAEELVTAGAVFG
ncbi:Uncharacterised protein [Porphyromonas cangingivalis]|uniref:Uncharacterized protein n=1 Tax=Porphyromonas cangingivalis TaxID=36874 RepID=A0A1T4K6B1_PORCN|nr:hypothetical protein SAMN02745205_00617 [Porphyromonas cangingivalis]VEJ03539.1 Uncharacterised protein [Porphyromonas cangingivalis]